MNGVYPSRGQADKNQEHLLRQINLVGLNRWPGWPMVVAQGFVIFTLSA